MEGLAVSPLFAAVTVLAFWPVLRAPWSTIFRPFESHIIPDVNLVFWILSTVAESLINNPTDLFAGNALFPDPAPIAHTEHFLALQLSFLPLYLLTGNPVLSMQGTLFLNFALCGVSMFVLLRHWKLSVAAAVFGGFVYAAFPMRYFFIHSPHVSAVQYLPLAVLFLDRSLARGRVADAALLAVFLSLQMLVSFYLAYISLFVLASFGLAKVVVSRPGSLRPILVTGFGALCAAVPLVFMALPYLQQSAIGAFPEQDHDLLVMTSSTPIRSYLYSPMAVRLWDWVTVGPETYIGLVPLALAVVGLFSWRHPAALVPILSLLSAAAVSYLLSLGPRRGAEATLLGFPYELASAWIPGFSVMRVPFRFAAGVILGVAPLAALGFDALLVVLRRRPSLAKLIPFLTLGLGLAVAAEFGLFHFRYSSTPAPVGSALPPVYQALRAAERGPVLELPGGYIDGTFQHLESRYAYFNVFHRQKQLNGYTGYWPESYRLLMGLARALPDPRALGLLTRLTGLRYVVLHERKLSAAETPLWQSPPGLIERERFGRDVLYEVSPQPADLLSPLLENRGAGTTVLGTPLVALAGNDLKQSVDLVGQTADDVRVSLSNRRGFAPQATRVRVRNRSGVAWPSLALDPEHVVFLVYRWEVGLDTVLSEWSVRLPYDLGPGESLATTLRVLVPRRFSGPTRLVVGLRQGDRWFRDPLVIEDIVVGNPVVR